MIFCSKWSTSQVLVKYLKHSVLHMCMVVFVVSFCTEVSMETGLNSDDIVSTLQYYGLLKYWKGKHIILKRKVS